MGGRPGERGVRSRRCGTLQAKEEPDYPQCERGAATGPGQRNDASEEVMISLVAEKSGWLAGTMGGDGRRQ